MAELIAKALIAEALIAKEPVPPHNKISLERRAFSYCRFTGMMT